MHPISLSSFFIPGYSFLLARHHLHRIPTTFQFYSFTLRDTPVLDFPKLFLSWHKRSSGQVKQRYNTMAGLYSNTFAIYEVKKTEDKKGAYSELSETAAFFLLQ